MDRDGSEHDLDVANLTLLIRLGREQQVMESIEFIGEPDRPERLAKLAIAMQSISKPRAHALLQDAASGSVMFDEQYVKIARAWVTLGERDRARRVLNDAEAKFKDVTYPRPRERVAEAWLLVGEPQRARQVLLEKDGAIELDFVDTLIRVNDPADRKRIANAVAVVLASLGTPNAEREVRFLFIVQAFLDVGNLDEAKKLLAASPTAVTRDEVLKKISLAEARLHGRLPRASVFGEIEDENVKNSLIDELLSRAARAGRDTDVERLINEGADPNVARAAYTKHLMNAGGFEKAVEQARRVVQPPQVSELFALTRARLAYALARTGQRANAEKKIGEASDWSRWLTESGRDEVRSILAATLAVLGRYRDARAMADSIESDDYQLQAYFAILRIYDESRSRFKSGSSPRS